MDHHRRSHQDRGATALAIALAGAWAFWIAPPSRPRSGEVLAVLLLLPVGAGWLLVTSLRRRNAVLGGEK